MNATEVPAIFKRIYTVLLVLGIIFTVGGLALSDNLLSHIFTALHINGLFLTGIGLFGSFFIALNYAAGSAWNASLIRILEAISKILPVGILMVGIVILGALFHLHHIFHWLDPAAVQADPVIKEKSLYLNRTFFILRFHLIMLPWIFLSRKILKLNNAFTTANMYENYKKLRIWSAIYLAVILISAPLAAWDWILSIDFHWYSTIFGWYAFASWWTIGLATFAILTIIMKRSPSYSFINKNHYHDISKWLFTVALVWCYAFYFQYMLIWYAHIPEEITYFQPRVNEYSTLFWGIFAVNFFVPFFGLMDRYAKRNEKILLTVAILLLIGHWLNTYLSVVPGVYGTRPPFPLLDLGILLVAMGIAIWLIKKYLTEASPLISNHPLLSESLEYHSDSR